MQLLSIDLLGLEMKELEWYQMFTRAVIIFFVALGFIRFTGMRSFGTQSSFDVVFSITLGGVLSRCITGHYPFLPTLGTALVLALLHRIVAFFSYRSEKFNALVEGNEIELYAKGEKNRKNLARHSIADSELTQALRESSMEDFSKVKSMWLEADGKISIVKKEN